MISRTFSEGARFSDVSVVVPMALGSTLLSTVVVRLLKQREPARTIRCVARHGDLFNGSPHVHEVIDPSAPDVFTRALQDKAIIDLNGTLDFQPHRRSQPIHLIELLCERAGVANDGRGPECVLTDDERRWAQSEIQRHRTSRTLATILIATKTSTINKEWKHDRWQSLIDGLGPNILWLHVGEARERRLNGVTYLVPSARQTIALAAAVSGVVTLDTFLLHATACSGRPPCSVVVLLGSSRPECVSYPDFHNLYLEQYDCQPCGRPYSRQDLQLLPSGDVARWPNGKPMKWTCEHVACMDLVTADSVSEAVRSCILEFQRPLEQPP